MSFRSRLTLFFVAIVIVPMASMAIVLFRLLSDNEHGKGDARIAARQEAAIHLYDERATRPAWRARSRATTRRWRQRCAPATAAGSSGGRAAAGEPASRGSSCATRRARSATPAADAAFPATLQLVDERRRSSGRSRSRPRRRRVRRLVHRIAGLDAVVLRDGHGSPARCPAWRRRAARAPGPRDRANATTASRRSRRPGSRARTSQVSVLDNSSVTAGNVRSSRRIAGGDPDRLLHPCVHVRGPRVALAAAPDPRLPRCRPPPRLGRLLRPGADRRPRRVRRAGRAVQPDGQPARGARGGPAPGAGPAESAMQRIGETFASNLDRDALLEIVVRTAVDGVAAEAGRATVARTLRSRCGRSRPWATGGARGSFAPPRRSCSRPGSRRARTSTMRTLSPHPLRAADGEGRVTGDHLGRPPRQAVLRQRARPVPLPRRAGRGVGRERRPARDRRAPGRHRRAHRACRTAAASRRRSPARSRAHSASTRAWAW